MANYSITGIWKGDDDAVTHYAIHTMYDNGTISRSQKTGKASAIALVDDARNRVVTWIWNYRTSQFTIGETVHVVNGFNERYLRSNRDDRTTDNLKHLIDCNYFYV